MKKRWSIGLLGLMMLVGMMSLSHPTKEKKAVALDAASGASYYADNANDQYYKGISDDLVGEDLITALSTLTSTGFVSHSYSSLPNIYQYSDASLTSSGKIRLAYTGTEVNFPTTGMPSNTNKEHVWPASWYGTGNRTESAGSPGADAHNVWPAATDLNSKRGSCAFDELNFSTDFKCYEFDGYDYGTEGDNDSYVWSTAHNRSNGQPTDAMYPAKGHRGEIARILMYVATRYRNDNTYKVMLHDQAQTLKIGRIGKLSTLLKWHYEEPPSEWEQRRNNEVASRWHHNRNPFIDHPEYASRIYYYLNEPDQNAPSTNVQKVIDTYGDLKQVDVESIQISPRDFKMVVGAKKNLSIEAFPQGASKLVTWKSLDETIAKVSSSGEVTALNKGTVRIQATSLKNTLISDEITITVTDVESISLSGSLLKSTYEEGETFDPTGLVVTAIYSDRQESIVPNEDCSWLDANSEKKVLSLGTTEVLCKYGKCSATYAGITVKKSENKGYVKVTSQEALTDGKYLIVNEENTLAFNGALSTYDAPNNGVNVEIQNGTIAPSIELEKAAVTFQANEGTFLGTSNQYVGHTDSKNSIQGSTQPLSHDVKISNGEAVISSGAYSLRFNDNNGQMRFRYYKSGQQPVQLYKRMGGEITPVEVQLVRLEIQGTLNKTNYIEGESLDLSGIQVIAYYDDGTTKDVTHQIEYPSLEVGMTEITLSYEENQIRKEVTLHGIQVKKQDIPLTGILLNYENYTLKEGETFTLIASYQPEDATHVKISFESQNIEIASVDEKGVVLAKKEGTATIVAFDESKEHEAICIVKVEKKEVSPSTSITPSSSTNLPSSSDHSSVSNSSSTSRGCAKASFHILDLCIVSLVVFIFIKKNQ